MSTKSQLAAMRYLAKVRPRKYSIKSKGKTVTLFEWCAMYPDGLKSWEDCVTYDFYKNEFKIRYGW